MIFGGPIMSTLSEQYEHIKYLAAEILSTEMMHYADVENLRAIMTISAILKSIIFQTQKTDYRQAKMDIRKFGSQN